MQLSVSRPVSQRRIILPYRGIHPFIQPPLTSHHISQEYIIFDASKRNTRTIISFLEDLRTDELSERHPPPPLPTPASVHPSPEKVPPQEKPSSRRPSTNTDDVVGSCPSFEPVRTLALARTPRRFFRLDLQSTFKPWTILPPGLFAQATSEAS